MIINILTQSVTPPTQIDNIMAPDFDTLKLYDWRMADESIPLANGYERTWVQDPVNEDQAIPVDTLIADRLERERLANIETNRERWTLENQFIVLCNNITSTTENKKLGFLELDAAISLLRQSDPDTAIGLSLRLLMLDAALKRYDLLWWDTCAWHPEVL